MTVRPVSLEVLLVAANPLAPDWLAVPADPDAIDDGLWPAGAHRDADGVLVVGGVRATDLVAQYGTPLYVLDERDVRGRIAEAVSAFQRAAEANGTSAHVYYAGKAFLSVDVARWMQAAGAGVDVCSGGELALVLAAGIQPGIIGFHGNNKSLAEIEAAVQAGVGTIVLDSVSEIGRVAAAAGAAGRTQGVRLRVNSGVHASTHEYLATAREDQKFGIALPDVPGIVRAIRAMPQLEFRGLHSHIGSQIFDTAGFREAARRLLEVQRELLWGGPIAELNLGGGFGIAYTTADDPVPLAEIADRLLGEVAAICDELRIPVPAVAVEPGRSIIGPAGITLYTVGTVKDVDVPGSDGTTAVRRYLSVDGGMSDNVRPALYEADYTVRLANRASAGQPTLVRVVGKHCESGDIVVRADYLPEDAGEDDVLAVAATGAYCASLASNYNYLGRPPVVAVADGVSRVLVRRETIADLLARDEGSVAVLR